LRFLLRSLFIFRCRFAIPSVILWLCTSPAHAATANNLFNPIATSNVVAQAIPAPTATPESDENQERATPEEKEKPSSDSPLTPETLETVDESQPFRVTKLIVTGSKTFSAAEILNYINQPNQPFKGCSVTFEEVTAKDENIVFRLNEQNSTNQPSNGCSVTRKEIESGISDRITQLYISANYITSRAVLPDQKVSNNGEVAIRVIEGGIAEIKVEGTQRVDPEYIRSRIRLAGLNPLNKDNLEDQLKLLRADPLFKNVEASLRPADVGSKVGQSIIVVRVVEANPLRATFGIDNYSPPSLGSERFGVGFAYQNLITSGDRISTSYNRSTTGGLNLYDFNYRLPLNAMDGSLQLRAGINNSRITDPQFKNLNIRGDSNVYEINYRQPLIRSTRQEFALSLGFTYQDGQTFLFDNGFRFGIGPDANGVSRTSVLRFGQDYISRDLKGAWTARSLFNFGIGLLDATINNHPTPDSRFFSWFGEVQRVQQLSENQQLIAGIDLQLTPNSLLPSQQYIIGGAQSVRGYRQNARSGDNGFRFSLEDQITVVRNEAGLATLQLAPFIDLGAVWNNPDNPNNVSLPAKRFLSSAGLGLLWQPIPKLNLRLDYGIPFVNLNEGNNAQDSGFHFSVYYQP
jgi:hemolysin activation/secretion protein